MSDPIKSNFVCFKYTTMSNGKDLYLIGFTNDLRFSFWHRIIECATNNKLYPIQKFRKKFNIPKKIKLK